MVDSNHVLVGGTDSMDIEVDVVDEVSKLIPIITLTVNKRASILPNIQSDNRRRMTSDALVHHVVCRIYRLLDVGFIHYSNVWLSVTK